MSDPVTNTDPAAGNAAGSDAANASTSTPAKAAGGAPAKGKANQTSAAGSPSPVASDATPSVKMIEIKIVGSVTHDGQVLPIGTTKLPAPDAKRLLALGPKIAVKPGDDE